MFKKGKDNPRYGKKPLIPFSKGNTLGLSNKGRIVTWGDKISKSRKGKCLGDLNSSKRPEVREKLRIANQGQKGIRKNTGRTHFKRGHIPFNKGKEHLSLNEHPMWKGGKSFEPYPVTFNRKLKLLIKERDKNICFICYSVIKLIVHHIDENKQNCEPSNLITLCRSCHMKVHHRKLSLSGG